MSALHATHPTEELLRVFLQGSLPEEEAVVVEEHLAACPACAGQLGQLDTAADGFLNQLRSAVGGTPPLETVTPVSAVPPPPTAADPLGTHLGPYRLVERLGEGGMGIVYKAEQLRPIHRWVALKVIRPGLDGRRVVARFEAERQALARMDHPHIAKVLDAGTADDGRPYFVMELVDGASLTTFCDTHGVELRDRLTLFATICDAVQHAHQKGVIHRDLKPSNILLEKVRHEGRDYQPKIIDFGIAKATEGRLTRATVATLDGQIVGTPDYMSPEQASLDTLDIDTRADVYALGVVLYELLTGTTPLELTRREGVPLTELLRAVREEEPPRPSHRRRANGLTTVEELDWIVLKALEKERDRRYATAHDLAADVSRYVRDQPVQACPPSTTYFLRKLARRYRRALLTAAAFVFLLLTATVVSLWQAVRATQAEAKASQDRDAADEARRRAEEAEKTARTEAGKVKEINRFFTQDILPNAAPEFNPVGDKVTLLDVLDRAAALVPGRFPDQPDVEVAVRVAVADAYLGLGAYAKSEPHYRAAVDAARRAAGEETGEALHARSQLGYALLRLRRLDEAAAFLASAVPGLIRVEGEEHPNTIQAMNNLALVHRARREFAEAETLFRRAIDLSRHTWGEEHFTTITIKYNLIQEYIEQGKETEAEPMLVELLEISQRAWGEKHPTSLGLANGLAHFYLRRGDFARSEPLFQRLLTACRHALGPQHPNTLIVLTRVAEHHHHKREHAEAQRLWEEVLEGRRKVYGPDHPTTVLTLEHLLNEYLTRKRIDKVEPLYLQLVETRRRQHGGDHEKIAAALMGLGVTRLALSRPAEAEAPLREGLRMFEQTRPNSLEHFNAQSQLGSALAVQKKYKEAEPLLLAGYEGMKAQLGEIPPRRREAVINARDRLVTLYQLWGKPIEAAHWRAEKIP